MTTRTTAQLNLTNGVDTYHESVRLNPHLLRKMEQAQRNMLISVRRNRKISKCFKYWAKQFRKWADMLIERAEVL